ncbi:MAG: hypothetical protein QXZ17_06685 [Nitrososphaerota archaeon]
MRSCSLNFRASYYAGPFIFPLVGTFSRLSGLLHEGHIPPSIYALGEPTSIMWALGGGPDMPAVESIMP